MQSSAVTKRLEGKVAIVTGGDRGIGRAIALRLAAEGADIAFCYRANRAGAEEVVDRITAGGAGAGNGRRALALQADLSDITQARTFIEAVFDRFGTADILVNNAGLERRADFWEVSEQDYDLVLNVNLKGVFFLTQAVVRQWIAAKHAGKIINISSVHEELPFPHFAAYCASKGGLKMLTRNLAVELAPFGITINNIAPGAIETPINKALLNDPAKLKPLLENIPLKRLGMPEDVSGVAAFLASADADYITGTTLFVDGGLLWSYEEQ
ncbi:MAG: glucose 1-dehydrogenase [Acidobacteriia bacterium]|nr:glucose 1-dehydrogenase [Terriglobia bacterium]